jgi:hypothetical protein
VAAAAVRSVGEMKHRLWTDQLAQWVEKLSDEKPIEPEALTELTVRLLATAVMVLRQHGVNKRGQCRLCTPSLRMLRFWWRRPPCTVCRAFDFAMGQPWDVVWWQLFESLGQQTSLDQARKWVAERAQAKSCSRDEQL